MNVTLAVDGADVLGFVAVVTDPADAAGEIHMIAVDPAAQRSGIGRALTECAVNQLRAAGCTLAVLTTGGDPDHAPVLADTLDEDAASLGLSVEMATSSVGEGHPTATLW